MLGVTMARYLYSKTFFRQEVVEHASSWTLTRNCYWVWRTGTMCGEQEPCVENRNHVWRTGTMCGEQEPCVE